ncbi:hypothetical protein [Humibacter sp.]|uniref:hypothetical protein n=1 Tax=Humibacter sp. TaxID=1940291 RepID=UPI003F80D829
MNAMAVRYGASSPRRADLPKAFTLGEFVRGALTAFLVFQPMGMIIAFVMAARIPFNLPITPPASAIWSSSLDDGLYGVLFGGIYGLPTSFSALIVGSPVAYLLGTALRRIRADWIHLAAFATYGMFVGISAFIVLNGVLHATADLVLPGLGSPFSYVPFVCAAGIAVALGRLISLQAARKRDAGRS